MTTGGMKDLWNEMRKRKTAASSQPQTAYLNGLGDSSYSSSMISSSIVSNSSSFCSRNATVEEGNTESPISNSPILQEEKPSTPSPFGLTECSVSRDALLEWNEHGETCAKAGAGGPVIFQPNVFARHALDPVSCAPTRAPGVGHFAETNCGRHQNSWPSPSLPVCQTPAPLLGQLAGRSQRNPPYFQAARPGDRLWCELVGPDPYRAPGLFEGPQGSSSLIPGSSGADFRDQVADCNQDGVAEVSLGVRVPRRRPRLRPAKPKRKEGQELGRMLFAAQYGTDDEREEAEALFLETASKDLILYDYARMVLRTLNAEARPTPAIPPPGQVHLATRRVT